MKSQSDIRRGLARTHETKPCVAREPLRYGSRACENPRSRWSDLCETHRRLIDPHQLIDGTFYIAREDEE